MHNLQDKINNLFALWDPIGVKKIEPGIQYDEYKLYAAKIASGEISNIKVYLVEIFTDMVNDPDNNDMQEIETMDYLINKILEG